MAFDDFRHNIGFHGLCDIIQKHQSLNESSKVYVKWAEKFFEEISKSLDSILNPDEEGGYYFMQPSVKEILEIYGKDTSNISDDAIFQAKQDFDLILKKLNNLENDSDSFYKSGDSEFTFNFLKKFLPRPGIFSEYPTNKTNLDLEGDD